MSINLVDLSKYPNFLKLQNQSFSPNLKKWSLNKIVLIAFVLFTIFFLYNCKYGIFKWNNPEIAAYS
jgi:hypothetical protein